MTRFPKDPDVLKSYKISTLDGMVEVRGRGVGKRRSLAVRHLKLGEQDWYVVDHTRTGRKVLELRDRKEAVEFARELDRLVGRGLVSESAADVKAAMTQAMRDWIAAVEDKGYVPFSRSHATVPG